MHTPGLRDPLQTASTPRVPRRAYQRLRVHRRMLPLLAALTLLTGLLISGAAYVALRLGAVSAEQTIAVNELGLALVLMTLLMTALAVLCGALLSGAPSSAALAKLDLRLNEVAGHAADLEQVVRAQVGRSQRQARLARQVSEYTRELNTLMEVIEQGQAALSDSAGEIWAGMSQPGQALDPATASRLAQQSAVVAGRIGSATEDARDRCRHLIGMMNQVIAEGRVLGDEGRGLEERANALRRSIERVEVALGARVVDRQYDLPGHPFARRLRRVSRRIGTAPGASAPPSTSQSGLPPAASRGSGLPTISTVSGLPGVQPGSGSAQMWPPGQWPGAGLSSASSSLSMVPRTGSPSRPLSAVDPPLMHPSGPPPGMPPSGDQSRPASRPLWAKSDTWRPSAPGEPRPESSLPGISSLPPGISFSTGSQPGRPSDSNSSGRLPHPSGPPRDGDWLAGKSPSPIGSGAWPIWPPEPPIRPSQPPPGTPPRWPMDGSQPPPFPPSGPQQPGPGHDAPPTGWLNS